MKNVHIEQGPYDVALPPTATLYQHTARICNEAARLKAAHRYFQRTATRRPFRHGETEDLT
ncbi:MAG: hypothetical protein LC793_24145 [Thermomicrobia bacterium]|nr:hypothetical protein [Thermomicrobia bacterium]